MAVDRFIIIRNVYLEGKNALIVAKKVTSIHIAESPKIMGVGNNKSNIVNSTKTKSTEMKRKLVKVQMNNTEVKFQLDARSDMTLMNKLGRKLADQCY